MSNDPVQDLIDQLKLMRVEIADVKSRQITEERLKHLQAALEDNAKQIAGVQQAAANGGKEGAERLTYSLDRTASKVEQKVDDAVRALSEARREPSGTILARRRNVPSLCYSQPLQGLPQALCLRWSCLITIWNATFGIRCRLWGWIWPVVPKAGLSQIRKTGSSVCSKSASNPQFPLVLILLPTE